ncbi:hypothetical protein DRP77_06180 [Candidatus Poribacteria bacterium]|nr:MAG: hypothetical protein DRP77_06180 [Candidatus Poribacteria bacterium]
MKVEIDEGRIRIETDKLCAEVRTEGYVSGVAGGSFTDKLTGARDLGFGLDVVDFLLEPGEDKPETPSEMRYRWGDKIHGNIPKRYVELPQICTKAGRLDFEVVCGRGVIGVRQWFRFREAAPGYKPGSLWQQWLVFLEGRRFILASDRITSANDVESLILRIDMPGHIKHSRGDTFEAIYLSYHGIIPAEEFCEDFAPDERFLYRRSGKPPDRFIRAYKIRGGPWLAGMTLEPGIVYEAWCHQRGYVCMIQEIGGLRVREGESFGAAYIIGFFDSIEEMERVYDEFKGVSSVEVREGKLRLAGSQAK